MRGGSAAFTKTLEFIASTCNRKKMKIWWVDLKSHDIADRTRSVISRRTRLGISEVHKQT